VVGNATPANTVVPDAAPAGSGQTVSVPSAGLTITAPSTTASAGTCSAPTTPETEDPDSAKPDRQGLPGLLAWLLFGRS